ncbi:hypothetical protein [Myxococcus sp. Y35]|uniref:hypothetical protein n=1 Tax=Pseudomyxococcus flavus TaxID=3115648 RepID=UPI003CECBA7E
MVAIRIIPLFLKSGTPFPAQVMRATSGDVTLTLEVDGQRRDVAVNDSHTQASVTVRVSGGAPNIVQVTDWGAAAVGSRVTLFVATPEGATDSWTARVGT